MKASDLVVSTGPHWHHGSRITGSAYMTLVALSPAVLAGCIIYGAGALSVIGVAVSAAVIAEALMQILVRKPVSVADGSAAVSGLLFALILPAGTPTYVVAVGSAFGIIVGKQCFGGLGANPLNPALVSWAVVRVTQAWSGFLDIDLALAGYNTGLSYPLAVLQAKGAAAINDMSITGLFFHQQLGGIGTAIQACVLLGGLFLVLRGVVRWEIPAFFLIGVVAAALVFRAQNPSVYASPLFHLVAGNALLGAFFLSTDHASSPVNRWGMVFFGLGCGVLTVLFRAWSVYPDGVVFACLLMSLFVPMLDKVKGRQEAATPTPLPGINAAQGEGAAS